MTFFPPKREADQSLAADPGWAAYVRDPAAVAESTPVRVATDLVLADTERALLQIPAVDVHEDHVTFEVRSELREIRDGITLSEFLDARMAEEAEDRTPGPPSASLLVGLELSDGSQLHTYPTGRDGHGRLRLESLGGGASGGRDESAKLRQTFVVRGGVPVGPFRVICSFEAVGIHEASATIEAPEAA